MVLRPYLHNPVFVAEDFQSPQDVLGSLGDVVFVDPLLRAMSPIHGNVLNDVEQAGLIRSDRPSLARYVSDEPCCM